MIASKSRENQIHSPSSKIKPKKNSCCCACFNCFGRSVSESPSEIYLDKSREPTELLVEKMVVQRVPVRLFATEKDYKKIQAERIKNKNQQPFEKYYSTLPKIDIKSASSTKVRSLEDSAISLNDVEVEIHEEKSPFVENIKGARVKRHLVTPMLNDLCSLHTLDDSKRIPKDPCPVNPPKKPPNALAELPSHWKPHNNNTEQNKSTTLQVGGKELTPEMKDTLLMLGSAKKPGNYRLQRYSMRKSQKKKDIVKKNSKDSIGSKIN